ncbi:MAG: hydrogenase expression protein HypE [Solirubrobacterales bacterium]|nr:MAG: hydrogenase expression protein HypE [Solirubrobacterales bacterium]
MLLAERVRMQAELEGRPVNVLWLTSGLGCDGDSVAMTAATNPSLEDLLRGCFPGVPPVIVYNPLLAYESGADFMRAFFDAAAGRLDPFILVLEGSVPNEQISGEGDWATLGADAAGDPISTCTWIDRLAPRAAAVLALGSCAAYGGIPAMRGNPTGAMGLRDYLGPSWVSALGLPIVNLPGCPVQPDNITETLLVLALHLAGSGPAIDLDEQGRPRWLFGRTVQEGCARAGFAEQGEFARTPADDRGCLVKLGCKGPVAKCNVPIRGWIGGVGGCPNVGGICIGCTMPGFPDKFMPFMAPSRLGLLVAASSQLTYGPVLRRLRRRVIRRRFDREPEWRRPASRLDTGYDPRW